MNQLDGKHLNLTPQELRIPVHEHRQHARNYEAQADRIGGLASTLEADGDRLTREAKIHRDAALMHGPGAARWRVYQGIRFPPAAARANARALNKLRQAHANRGAAETLRAA